MKVLFCKGGIFGPVSGIDQYMGNYAAQLIRLGHAVELLVVYRPNHDDHYYRRFVAMGMRVRHIEGSVRYSALRAWRQVAVRAGGSARWRDPDELLYLTALARIHRARPAVVHVLEPNGGTAAVIRAAHEIGVPVLYQESSIPRAFPEVERWYAQLAPVLSRCSVVAALSPRLVSMCRDGFPFDGRIDVLPLLAEYVKSPPPPPSHHGVTIGFASRMDRWKGPAVLVDAFARLAARWPEARLAMAGTGIDAESVRAHAATLGIASRCEFPGAFEGAEQRTRFMAGIDIFVQPSFIDGTPSSIIEAMAHARPIIASDIGGIPDLIGDDSGVAVKPGDVDAFASAMSQLIADREGRRRMGEAARLRYEQHYTPAAIVPVLLDLYQRATGRAWTRQAG